MGLSACYYAPSLAVIRSWSFLLLSHILFFFSCGTAVPRDGMFPALVHSHRRLRLSITVLCARPPSSSRMRTVRDFVAPHPPSLLQGTFFFFHCLFHTHTSKSVHSCSLAVRNAEQDHLHLPHLLHLSSLSHELSPSPLVSHIVPFAHYSLSLSSLVFPGPEARQIYFRILYLYSHIEPKTQISCKTRKGLSFAGVNTVWREMRRVIHCDF